MVQKFTGQTIVPGEVEGEVLVTSQPFYFNWVDLDTGMVNQAGHQLDGKSVSGKILVVPSFKANIDMWVLYRICLRGNGPLGLITPRLADDYMVVGSTLANLPLIHLVVPNPIEVLSDGQRVRMQKDTIEISTIE